MSEERDVRKARKAKMEAWLAAGGGYQNDFRRQHFANELHAQHADADKEALAEQAVATAVAGRIMLRRGMGKAQPEGRVRLPPRLGARAKGRPA